MSWHAKQSAHNRDAQLRLSKHSQYRDWEITALFYAVMHMIDEYLESIGKAPHNHAERNSLVRAELQHVYQDYYDFYALCIRVRYVVLFDSVTEHDRQTALDLYKSIRARLLGV